MPDHPDRQAEYLENRLRKRDRHLRKWARRESVECYRVYNRDIPEIPLTVDRYGTYALVSLFERPYEKPEEEERSWLDRMCSVVSRTLEIPEDAVFRKMRRRQRGNRQYERISRQGRTAVVREGGLRFLVNLSDYLDTGLFLDHRITRSLVRDEARDRRVLNLFCYTGSFSVYAAAGGAASVDSVDLSKTYLAWAERNLDLNGFRGGSYPLINKDVLEYLVSSQSAGRRWDLIILDPPTFSNSKRMNGSLDIRRDWSDLAELCLETLSPEGVLYFSTNSRSFRFDETRLPGAVLKDLTKATTPPDFEGSRPHRCWRLESASPESGR